MEVAGLCSVNVMQWVLKVPIVIWEVEYPAYVFNGV